MGSFPFAVAEDFATLLLFLYFLSHYSITRLLEFFIFNNIQLKISEASGNLAGRGALALEHFRGSVLQEKQGTFS